MARSSKLFLVVLGVGGLATACSDATTIEQAGISVIEPSRAVVSEAGDQSTIEVVLTGPPSADVIIGVSVSDDDEATIDVSELVFTPANWDQRQTITVTGVADQTNTAPADAPDNFTVDFARVQSADEAYDGQDLDSVEFLNLDNFVEWEIIDMRTGEKPVGLSVAEGGAEIPLSVRLLDEPFTDVELTIALFDTEDGQVVLPADNLSFSADTPDVHEITLTFTPEDYNVAQRFDVYPMTDGGTPDPGKIFNLAASSTGDKAYEAFFTELALTPDMPLPISNLDPDSAEVVQTPPTITLCEGTVGQLFLQLSSLPQTGTIDVSLEGGEQFGISYQQPGEISTMNRLTFNVNSQENRINSDVIITGTMTVNTDDNAYLLNYGAGNETREFTVQLLNVDDRTGETPQDPDQQQQPNLIVPLCPAF